MCLRTLIRTHIHTYVVRVCVRACVCVWSERSDQCAMVKVLHVIINYTISKIRSLLDQARTEKLVHVFMKSRLDYCNSVLYWSLDWLRNKETPIHSKFSSTSKSADEVNLMRYHLIHTNYIHGRRNRRGGRQLPPPPPPILVTDSLLNNY